jgi:hypothetical protein
MYCFHHDPRVVGLVLANPWVRTEAGEAKALVHQYYGRRLLQRSLWHKLWSGQFDIRGSLRGLFAVLRLSAIRDTIIANDPRHFTQRMLAGFEAFSGPVLLLLSGRDLTAHEFEEFTKASRGWSMRLNRPSVNRVNLPHADHTFSGKAALDEATQAVIRWLDDPQLR